jgi:hypothetical protein
MAVTTLSRLAILFAVIRAAAAGPAFGPPNADWMPTPATRLLTAGADPTRGVVRPVRAAAGRAGPHPRRF